MGIGWCSCAKRICEKSHRVGELYDRTKCKKQVYLEEQQ